MQYSFLVPSLPPQNVTGHNTSSTSLFVNWKAVPVGHVHGILRGYYVFYHIKGKHTFVRTETMLHHMSLKGLHKFTEYEIRIAAFTIKGHGVKSKSIFVSTDEDGKFKTKTT